MNKIYSACIAVLFAAAAFLCVAKSGHAAEDKEQTESGAQAFRDGVGLDQNVSGMENHHRHPNSRAARACGALMNLCAYVELNSDAERY